MSGVLLTVALAALAGLLALPARAVWRRQIRILTSKRHLEAVFDHVDPMAVVDSGLRILRANKAFCRLVGGDWKTVLGRTLSETLGQKMSSVSDLAASRPDGRATFPDLSVQVGSRERVYDLHLHPLEDGELVVHLQETTDLALARRELLARNEALARLGEALRSEIEVAREIQSGLLPRELPVVDGAAFHTRWQPSRPVGGDLYDILPLDGDRLGLFIADVSGHGLPAAFEAALVRMSFLNRAAGGAPPAQVLAAMNADLRRSLAAGHYVTAFYGVLDLATLELAYCRASHPRPAVIHPDNSIVKLGSQGLFLGVVDHAEYTESTLRLASGDRLCLFTDGYYEGLRRDGRRLGYDAFLRRVAGCERDDLLQELADIEDEFAPCQEEDGREDDRTFLAMDILSEHLALRPRVHGRFPDGCRPAIRTFRTAGEGWALVDRLVEELLAAGWDLRAARKAQLAASELSINAVCHGLRLAPGGAVRATWSIDAERCLFAVDDDGPGFDPERLPDPRRPERLTLDHGRGIFLVRRAVDELWFDNGGATATFRLARGDAGPSGS